MYETIDKDAKIRHLGMDRNKIFWDVIIHLKQTDLDELDTFNPVGQRLVARLVINRTLPNTSSCYRKNK